MKCRLIILSVYKTPHLYFSPKFYILNFNIVGILCDKYRLWSNRNLVTLTVTKIISKSMKIWIFSSYRFIEQYHCRENNWPKENHTNV